MTLPNTLFIQMQNRGDTAASWIANNPTPLDREICIETDTGKIKIGDGIHPWIALPYNNVLSNSLADDVAYLMSSDIARLCSGLEGNETSEAIITVSLDKTKINIAANSGFYNDHTGFTGNFGRVTWEAMTDLSPVGEGVNFVSIYKDGTPIISSTLPPMASSVRLGHFFVSNGLIIGEPWNIPEWTGHYQGRVNEWMKHFGKQVVDGLVISEDPNNLLNILMSEGEAYIRLSEFEFNPISTFKNVYFNGGFWVETTGPITTTYYNNPTSGLVEMTEGYWGKHTVLLHPAGLLYVITSQAQYASKADAIQASPPNIPEDISTDSLFRANIVYRKGDTSIANGIRVEGIDQTVADIQQQINTMKRIMGVEVVVDSAGFGDFLNPNDAVDAGYTKIAYLKGYYKLTRDKIINNPRASFVEIGESKADVIIDSDGYFQNVEGVPLLDSDKVGEGVLSTVFGPLKIANGSDMVISDDHLTDFIANGVTTDYYFWLPDSNVSVKIIAVNQYSIQLERAYVGSKTTLNHWVVNYSRQTGYNVFMSRGLGYLSFDTGSYEVFSVDNNVDFIAEGVEAGMYLRLSQNTKGYFHKITQVNQYSVILETPISAATNAAVGRWGIEWNYEDPVVKGITFFNSMAMSAGPGQRYTYGDGDPGFTLQWGNQNWSNTGFIRPSMENIDFRNPIGFGGISIYWGPGKEWKVDSVFVDPTMPFFYCPRNSSVVNSFALGGAYFYPGSIGRNTQFAQYLSQDNYDGLSADNICNVLYEGNHYIPGIYIDYLNDNQDPGINIGLRAVGNTYADAFFSPDLFSTSGIINKGGWSPIIRGISANSILSNEDHIIFVSDLSEDITVELPYLSQFNQEIRIKQVGETNGFKVTIQPNGGNVGWTIEGFPYIELTNKNDDVTLIPDKAIAAWQKTREPTPDFPHEDTATSVLSLNDFYDYAWSATSVSGFDLTNNGDGTVTLDIGEVVLRSDALPTAPLKTLVCQGGGPLLWDNDTTYVYVEYTGPGVSLNSTTDMSVVNCQNKCLLWKIARVGTSLFIVDARFMGVDSQRKHRQKLIATEQFAYAASEGGLKLSETGTRKLLLTPGAFFFGLNRIDISQIDTSGSGSFTTVYRDNPSGWVRTTGQTTVENTYWDDGSGTLQVALNNKFINRWVYLIPDTPTRLYVVYGRAQFNSRIEAEAEESYTSLPSELSGVGVLIDRITIGKGDTNFTSIGNFLQKAPTTSNAETHNGLAGLQGGTTNEYYHLTAAQYNDLTSKVYGSLYHDETCRVKASSVSVTNGTITSGTVTDTQTINQVYLDVQETGSFLIEFTFSTMSNDPARLKFVGRYQGNAAHNVKLEFWNYNSSTWDSATAATTDFPNSTTDYALFFSYPAASANYRNGTESKVRINHTSGATSTHHFFTDHIAIIQKSLTVTNAGTFYVLTGATADDYSNTTLDGANGTITVGQTAEYIVSMHVSFEGVAQTTYHVHVFKNGTEIDKIGAKETMGANGEITCISASNPISLAANDVLDIRFSADTSGSFVGVEYAQLNVRKI